MKVFFWGATFLTLFFSLSIGAVDWAFLPDMQHWAPVSFIEARRLISMGAYTEAEALLASAHVQDPENVDIILAWADLYVRQGRRRVAESLLKKAVHDFPQYPEVYNNYAVLYADTHSPEEACALLQEGANIDPGFQPIHSNAHLLGCVDHGFTVVSGGGPASHSSASEQSHQSIAVFIQDWLMAWSRKEITRFLDAYLPSYAPPLAWNYGQWRVRREERIRSMGAIYVRQASPLFYLQESLGHTATVCFLQVFQSEKLTRKTYKVLSLQKYHHAWRIQKEFLSQLPCSLLVHRSA